MHGNEKIPLDSVIQYKEGKHIIHTHVCTEVKDIQMLCINLTYVMSGCQVEEHREIKQYADNICKLEIDLSQYYRLM